VIINKLTVVVPNDTPEERVAEMAFSNSFGNGNNKAYYYLVSVDENSITLCQMIQHGADFEKSAQDYLAKQGIKPEIIAISELAVNECAQLLTESHELNFCPELPEIFGPKGMMPFVAEPFSDAITEVRCVDMQSKKEVLNRAKTLHSNSLAEELHRIYEGSPVRFCGHPVLYSICADDTNSGIDISECLCDALYGMNRVPSTRAAILTLDKVRLPEALLRDLYKAQEGGILLVMTPTTTDPEILEDSIRTLRNLSKLAAEYRGSVLTIFITEKGKENSLRNVRRCLRNITLINISEDAYSAKETAKRLKALAKEQGIKSTAGLCKGLTKEEYSEKEIKRIFAGWYDMYLKLEAFPQYAEVAYAKDTVTVQPKEKKQPSAFDELSRLIGLTEAKKILGQARDYVLAQKIYEKRGYKAEMPCLHMVFTGNPGTCKTTVARLTAKLFKECGVLSKGELIECGRADLVGKFVGTTAPLVKQKFAEAKGNLLFIDEAYSLFEEKEGMFGDEALATICAELENQRQDTIVVFAGYKEPMQRLLDRNIGLRSRIAFSIDFPDYSEEEMMEIVKLNLEDKQRVIDVKTEDKVRKLIRSKMGDPQFGNGRYARTLVEQAMLSQASRIVKMPEEKITDNEIRYLTENDFPDLDAKEPEVIRKPIGFAC